MGYSIQSDLEKRISAAELAQLTDDTGGGTIDAAKIADAIEDADSEIDGYCADRYSVPFNPVPKLIRNVSAAMAIYNLASRRGRITEAIQERHTGAIRLLRDLAKGDVVIGTAPATTISDDAAEITAPGRVFSRDNMSEF